LKTNPAIDKERSVWLGRWREDDSADGQHAARSGLQVIGTLRHLPMNTRSAGLVLDCIEREGRKTRSEYRPLHDCDI